jgi:hypothetical protein
MGEKSGPERPEDRAKRGSAERAAAVKRYSMFGFLPTLINLPPSRRGKRPPHRPDDER